MFFILNLMQEQDIGNKAWKIIGKDQGDGVD